MKRLAAFELAVGNKSLLFESTNCNMSLLVKEMEMNQNGNTPFLIERSYVQDFIKTQGFSTDLVPLKSCCSGDMSL